ncbi:hypothetical protein D9753_18960 [Streptomyces dangxiongensis]|uniref:Uncharacterized protein n=1 Tax=Streptomyces dangxiongensis TaxID=1442032 RepID=A0A3G2JMY8_9ACTN|nr:hypothetical protein [Streptomyces dangxiongensis]AYN43743.1 hypothetical protein D9753_18960 [Streptomyces dangxiongensis]
MAVTAAQQDGPERARPGQEHLTTTAEQGRFCVARCSCGWRGPARRARSQARTDAEGHTTLQ